MKQLFTVTARREDTEVLAEVVDCSWDDVPALVATWAKQFREGMKQDDLEWNQQGYITVVPQL